MENQIAIRLYNNTEEKFLNSLDDVAKAKQSIVFEELGIICNLRKSSFDVERMKAVIAFLVQTGFDYQDMYIIDKIIDYPEVTYKFGYMHNDKTFDIITQKEGSLIHICIMLSIKQ